MSRLNRGIQFILSGIMLIAIACLFPLQKANAAHVGGDGTAFHGDGSGYYGTDVFRKSDENPNNVLVESELGYIDDALGENDPLIKASSLSESEKKGKTEDEVNALIQAKRNAIPSSSGPFSFRPGAALWIEENKRIGFSVDLTRTKETWKIANTQKTGEYGGFYRFKFYLVRSNNNQRDTDISVSTYVFQNTKTQSSRTYIGSSILDKDKYDTMEGVIQTNTLSNSATKVPYTLDWGQESTDDLSALYDQGIDPFSDDYVETLPEKKKKYSLKVFFDLDKLGVYTSYRVYFSYEYVPIVEKTENQDWFLWIHWGNGTYNYAFGEPESYLIKSDVRSYYQVLNNLTNAGDFDPESESNSKVKPSPDLREFWIKLLNDEGNTVNVDYLAQIEGTPFAKKERAQITVRTTNVAGSTLLPDDVASAMGIESFHFNTAPIEAFIYNVSENAYVAKYYNTVNLKTVTTEGKRMEYYLNPNKSFREFYFDFVTGDNPVISLDCYNYMIGALKSNYPQLQDFQDTEIYGFWGYAVTPQTHLFSDIFATIQNKDTAFNGVEKHYELSGTLSIGAYNRLLGEDYGYGWLQIVFSDLMNAIPAGGVFEVKHYFVYADGKYTKTSIDQTGSSDVDNTTSVLNGDIQAAAKIGTETVKGAFNAINSLLNTISSNMPTLLVFVAVVGGIAVIIYVNNQSRPSTAKASGGATRKSSKSTGAKKKVIPKRRKKR